MTEKELIEETQARLDHDEIVDVDLVRQLIAALESLSRERAVLVGLMKDVQAALLGADGPNGFGLWALPIEIEERLRLALIGEGEEAKK